MPRPGYNTTVPGTYTNHLGSVFPVPDALKASESATGTKRVKPKGWKDPTPYALNRENYRRHQGACTYRYRNVPERGPWIVNSGYYGCVGGSSTINSLNSFDETYIMQDIPSSWQTQCLIKARNSIKDLSVNLPLAFAERNRTAKQVGDTAFQLVKALRLAKRGQMREAAKALGVINPKNKHRGSAATSRWLELQYGWQPLLADVYGSCRALAERDSTDWIVTGKGSVIDRIDVDKMTGTSMAYGRGRAKGFRGAYGRIDAFPGNDLLTSFTGLGITNPAELAWELLPFSFVVDWFVPVGSFLSSLDALLGYDLCFWSYSEMKKCNWSHTLQGYSFMSGGGVYENVYDLSGSASKQSIRLRRVTSTSVPLPEYPYIKDPRSLTHMANGMSLLAQVFGATDRK